MQSRALSVIAIGCAVIVSVGLFRPNIPVIAQAGSSSCQTCHEAQAQKPVANSGQWHTQHANVSCQTCHAGDPQAADQQQAHIGVIRNPLIQAEARCSLCHEGDYVARVATYTPLLPTATATVAATPTSTPTATPVVTRSTLHPPTLSAQATATSTVTPIVQTSTPSTSPSASSSTTPSSGTDWLLVLKFTRGPLFQACLIIFLVGMVYRLIQALRPGWKHRRATNKPARASAIVQSFAQGLIIFPYIPRARSGFKHSAVTYIAGGLFHVGLFGVIFLSNTHMQVWKSLIGFGWPVLPPAVVGWLAVVGIVSMVALLLHRIINPVLKLLSSLADYLNWLFVFLPMITGFLMTHQLWQPYEMAYSIHMLTVDALLIWIPLSRISHFMFYFFSRTIHGLEFGPRNA